MTSEADRQAGGSRWLIIVLVLVVVGLAGWRTFVILTDPDPTRAVELADVVKAGDAAGYNILFLTLDTTRPDHLGCYGYEPAQTPTIDSLVNHGVRFDDAVTSVPITLPSHSTMMTGCYPPTLKVRTNGLYELDSEYETLAEVLEGKGYDTAAFISSFVLDKRFGISQGFAEYDFQVTNESTRHVSDLHNERRAKDASTAAINWLKEFSTNRGDSPFFMWVHYFDPHAPYDSPIANAGLSRIEAYDAEIAYVDLHIKRLLDTVDELGLRERTLIVLATDHGEGLQEHDEDCHAVFVYDSTVKVALILSCPTLFDRPYRVDDRVVGLIDIYPTVLDMLGVDCPEGVDGLSLVKGGFPSDRMIYVESVYPYMHMGCAPLYALRAHGAKYIMAPDPEFYNLKKDPHELLNKYESGSKKLVLMERELTELVGKWSILSNGQPTGNLTAEEVARLEDLGYLVGGRGADGDETALRDPKDLVHVMNRLMEFLESASSGDVEGAIAIGEPLVEEAGGWSAPAERLSDFYSKLERWDDASRVLDGFVKKHQDSGMLHRLAKVYFDSRQWTECEETLKVTEAIEPLMGAVPLLRGDCFFEQGAYDKAIEQYERALEIDGDRVGPDAHARIARARKHL